MIKPLPDDSLSRKAALDSYNVISESIKLRLQDVSCNENDEKEIINRSVLRIGNLIV